MIIKSLLALVATSALAMKLVQHLGQQQQQRRVRHEGRQHLDDVSRWEAEGGNQPVTNPVARAPAKRRVGRASRASRQ